ncbi:MAG: hypothetical protein QOE76_3842, partial [Frankiales bacterium]|nr:hypothetical protein [Frankiales bacterium]
LEPNSAAEDVVQQDALIAACAGLSGITLQS